MVGQDEWNGDVSCPDRCSEAHGQRSKGFVIDLDSFSTPGILLLARNLFCPANRFSLFQFGTVWDSRTEVCIEVRIAAPNPS